ncbi:hypothetical protein COLO4_17766 [Corchorus olitorius]|uniref:TF-B3 domain-containing protein n=1 Tax=Corchorus olitorius TaxID=93759 RepID=A0A1R3JBP4_9ROSI|nr:hypothetical protein COLO4_17766 [Corchorus olitorius]
MAIKKKIEKGDRKKLTIGVSSEPFPSAKGKFKVQDEEDTVWTFDYKVSDNTLVISGDWYKFFQSNGVKVGHSIAIDDNYTARKCFAEYKIEVTKGG